MSTPVLPRTSDLVRYQKVDGAHRVALRAGVSVAVPLAVVLWLGHVEWSPYACFGAFASLYGRASEHTTRVQMQGTTIGLLPSWLLLGLHLEPVLAVLAIALLQFGTEVLVGSNYALAMLCITPLALLNGQLAHPRPITQLLFDRGVETAIGGAVGIGLVLVGHALRERHKAKVDDALDGLRREVASRES